MLPVLFQLVSAEVAEQRHAALEIFSRVADYIAEALEPQLPMVVGIFAQRLVDPSNAVRLSATKAMFALVISNVENEKRQEPFQQLLPQILGGISDQNAISEANERVSAKG